ncbi:MAG: BadF/BadG/BcrA/BcrD ATPase family protein [Candidatus Kapaibacterium sp.]
MEFNKDFTIIGIDGGGTHTRGILLRDGKIVAESKAGSTRIGAVGVGESCERTLNVILDLCEQASIESSEVDAVVVGLAGVWLEEEKQRSARLLKTLGRGHDFHFSDLIVTSDAEIALRGAFDGGNGIITIIGTGSIALGNPNGDDLVRCGGWGIELDDEGSGAWIGREGLTAVVRAIDGRGKKTALTNIIADAYPSINIEQPRTIVKAYGEGAFQYHSLSPFVMQCAVDGDEICLDIIDRSATHLIELPLALVPSFKEKQVEVALMGGIVENDTLLADKLKEKINKHKSLKLVDARSTALIGALAMGSELIAEMS